MILKMGKSDENKEDNSFKHSLHEHQLRYHEKAQGPYKCNGCKQPGLDECFMCPKDACDFYLHKDCYRAERSPVKTPELMGECDEFHYQERPPRVADKYCDACGLDILGFRYECSAHGENPHDLHPTCANIKSGMDWKGRKWELRDKVESKCSHCGQRYPAEECAGFTGWKWVSEERDYEFPFCFWGRKICYHVKCVNEKRVPMEKKV